MARVHYVKRAGKDYPEIGVKKGEGYYHWTLYKRPTQRSKTRPSRSQLTGSSFKAQLYDLIDSTLPGCEGQGDLESLAGDVRELASEAQSSFDNMPESLQQGDTGQMLENRVSELEAWADEIESAASELGEKDEYTADGGDQPSWEEALASCIEDLEQSAPDPE